MKILIENTTPFNNGDAALIFGLSNQFKKKNYEVFFTTSNVKKAEEIYPEENWMGSLINNRILSVSILNIIYLKLFYLLNKSKLGVYDAVISAPGGYINSYYGRMLERRLLILTSYKKYFNIPLIMYSQSIGNMTETDQKILKKYSKYFDLIYVRDKKSYDRAVDYGLECQIVQTKDAAFLLDVVEKESNFKTNKVALSVRSWDKDNRDMVLYKNMIVEIVKYFVNHGFSIDFISTCQGLDGYIDDSKIAYEIYSELPLEIKEFVKVNDKFYNLSQLRKILTNYDFTVGTRLHMCILSWLSGTPAFNISYEEKGLECFKYLGIEEFSVDFNYNGNIQNKLCSFINFDFKNIFENISEIKFETVNYFNNVIKLIEGKSK